MPLPNNGLVKLSEECGELIQAAMKRVTCPDDIHWDGSNLKERLADEIADVRAASLVVEELCDLDSLRIVERVHRKRELFLYWHGGGEATAIVKESDDSWKATVEKIETVLTGNTTDLVKPPA